MIRFIHNTQIILMIAILAVSFFITYDFFITHISFKGELFLVSTVIVVAMTLIKFVLKLQIFLFVNRNKTTAEFIERINPVGKKRILAYDLLVWTFLLALALFQTKLFGFEDKLTMAYYFALLVDVLFWIAFHRKFQSALISKQLMLFSSRPEVVSLKNIKKVEKRFNDYYINYTTKKFSLLKSDLLSKKAEEKVNAFF